MMRLFPIVIMSAVVATITSISSLSKDGTTSAWPDGDTMWCRRDLASLLLEWDLPCGKRATYSCEWIPAEHCYLEVLTLLAGESVLHCATVSDIHAFLCPTDLRVVELRHAALLIKHLSDDSAHIRAFVDMDLDHIVARTFILGEDPANLSEMAIVMAQRSDDARIALEAIKWATSESGELFKPTRMSWETKEGKRGTSSASDEGEPYSGQERQPDQSDHQRR